VVLDVAHVVLVLRVVHLRGRAGLLRVTPTRSPATVSGGRRCTGRALGRKRRRRPTKVVGKRRARPGRHLREQRPRRRAQQAVDDRQAAAVRHAHLQPLHAVPRAARDQRLQARQQRLAALHAKALRARRAAVRRGVGLWRGAGGPRRAPRRRGRAGGRPARALECGKRSARHRSKRSVRSSARSVASCSATGGQALARASTARASHSCSSLRPHRPPLAGQPWRP